MKASRVLGVKMNDLLTNPEIVKNLGQFAPFVSMAIILVWLAKQAVSLRKDLQQNKVDAANALIKLWSELEENKSSGNDPSFQAIREEVLRRFGIHSAERQIPGSQLPAELSMKERFFISFLGALSAQTVLASISIVTMYLNGTLGSYASRFFPEASLVIIFGSVLAAAIVSFVLGNESEKRTYFGAGVVTGLATIFLSDFVTATFFGFIIP
jgi:hypothetical protein